MSGSGKSSLVGDILREALARDLNGAITEPGQHDRIEGIEHLDKVIDIDQSPIGRTPRSNPATYIKLFDLIRDLYTRLPDAKARGYKAGRFSFNVEGGRCEACEGNGSNRLEMDFLADVWVTCPVCEGQAVQPRDARTSGSRARASATSSRWTCRRRSSTSPTSPRSPPCSRPCTTSGSTT